MIRNAADGRDRSMQRPWHLEPRSNVMVVLTEVTGDFHRTLQDCKRFLKAHRRLQIGQSNPLTNLNLWFSGAGDDLDNLISRVQFHLTKVALITEPFKITLLSEIRRDLKEMKSDIAALTGIVSDRLNVESKWSERGCTMQRFDLPEDIAFRFVEASQAGAPSCDTVDPNAPLKRFFDALVFNFSKSTVEFRSMPHLGQNVPQGPQYLNLLKSIWIIRKIQASSEYSTLAYDSLWVEYMKVLEVDMRKEIRRFESRDLICPPFEVYSGLPAEYFTIWVEEKPLSQPLNVSDQVCTDLLLSFMTSRFF